MRRIRALHFWIGLIASLFLFIESLTGLIMYVNGEERGKPDGTGKFHAAKTQQMAINSQSGQPSPPTARGVNGDFPNKGGDTHSLQRVVRELHTGPIGLVSSIGMLVLTGTGLAISIQILLRKRKARLRKSVAI
jgi:hypothetical protein